MTIYKVELYRYPINDENVKGYSLCTSDGLYDGILYTIKAIGYFLFDSIYDYIFYIDIDFTHDDIDIEDIVYYIKSSERQKKLNELI